MLIKLYYVASFFLDDWLILFILAINAQTFIPSPELVIPTGVPNHETNTEIEAHPLTAKTKQENDQTISNPYTLFMLFTL